jgi:hypothetical protein
MGWDYWKVYVDEESYHEGHGQAYADYGIDQSRGANIIIRLDQYVSWVGEVDDYKEMSRVFSGFMKEQAAGNLRWIKPMHNLQLRDHDSMFDEACVFSSCHCLET